MSDIDRVAPAQGRERTVVITGATSVVGLETVHRPAAPYGTVVWHARTGGAGRR